jgi:PST family polysaccharide transporter
MRFTSPSRRKSRRSAGILSPPEPASSKKYSARCNRPGPIKLVLTFAIIAAGLAGRSAIDKVLALRGGGELVALWAQLSSVIELAAGVALAGVGTGLAVYVTRTKSPERQRELLREALRVGLGVALPVAVLLALGASVFSGVLTGGKLAPSVLALGAAAGWLAVIPGLINGYWLGQQRRDLMLALALGSAALALAVAALAPPRLVLPLLAVTQAAPALVLFLLRPVAAKPRFRARSHPLRRYVLPGLAIGILSPASMLVARGVVGEALSWHEAGVLQSLWRVSDWICGFAAGILSVYFLPRFAAVRASPLLAHELRRAAAWTLLPALVAFAALFLVHRPLLAALYDPAFHAPDAAVGLIFAGSVARIASWIPLFALYAMRRTMAITIGELFSLPLFATLLVVMGKHLTLEITGALWLVSYSAYCAFNFWALRR